jgi:hypothetical protein
MSKVCDLTGKSRLRELRFPLQPQNEAPFLPNLADQKVFHA